MKCYYCGGETKPELVTDLYAEGKLYLAIENVPAEVCQQCGERYYSPEVTQRLLDLTKEAQSHLLIGPKAKVVIWDFTQVAA